MTEPTRVAKVRAAGKDLLEMRRARAAGIEPETREGVPMDSDRTYVQKIRAVGKRLAELRRARAGAVNQSGALLMESDGLNRNQKLLIAAKHLHAAKQRREARRLTLSDVRCLIRELKPTIEEGPCPLPPDNELAHIGFAVVKHLQRIRGQVLLIDWRQRKADEGREDGAP
jgi:hypothetical protein